MKISVPVHICSIMLVLPLLLAVLQTTTAQKNGIHTYSLTVDSKVSSRFAHTVVTSRVVNRADEAQEAIFEMELPKKAFITNFSMIIDGVTYPGNIKEKAAAQEQYSAAVARGESAGLVKATGRKMEKFQVSVSVAPAAKVTFELVYEELLKRHLGVYELLLKVRPQQLVDHLQMDIHIFEPQGISSLDTESTFMTNELSEALTVSQNRTKAHIQFKPTLTQQKDIVLDGNFIVRYDVNRTLSGSIQIENGYFVHYFYPKDLPTMPKNVIFVIDKSGSMSGKKIQQTREALVKILSDLSSKDMFNLITFNHEATQWKPALVPASTENVNEAKSFAANIPAVGGTNINDAMLMAVDLLESSNRAELLSEGSFSLIILLTDGDPTSGETDPTRIQKNVREAIDGQHSLFCLGFGFDVSYAFLEKMALENGGLARRIYEDSDSALQLQDFYQEVANPLLTSVAFQYPSNAVEEVTQDNFRYLFEGSEMVVAGKLRDKSPDVLSATVKGKMHKQNITFQTESSVAKQEEEFRSPKYIFHNFMERLWAYLTIEQQLEQMVSTSDAESEAHKNQALNLSLKYNFVTPLTSMVVTKPEGQEQSQVAEKPAEDDNRHTNVHRGGYGLSRYSLGTQWSRITGGSSGYPRRRGGFGNQGILYSSPQRLGIGVPGTSKTSGQLGPPGPPGNPSHSDIQFQTLGDLALLRPMPPMQPMPPVLSEPEVAVLHGVEIQNKGPVVTAAPTPDPIEAPSVLLTLPGPSTDRLCVDIQESHQPMNLLSDPDQGIEVTGQHTNDGFLWIEVTFKKPEVHVRASPEQVVVRRNRRNSVYKWKKTLFSVLPGLKITMDKTGLLFSSPDKVTIKLGSMDGSGMGLLLLLQDTDRFSSHVNGIIGQFYQSMSWETPEAGNDSKRILKVQGKDYLATRELRLDIQEGTPGKEISCWTVDV